MLRVRTIYASAASSAAAYFAKYLAEAPGEQPGVWSGAQAAGLGLAGTVTVADLELLLSGRDPVSGTRLGQELIDRYGKDGKVKQAVAGFEATFSSPKSLSVWWALTGDDRLLDCHDVAVAAVLDHVERFGSTTRVRRDGRFTYPDTGGLVMATFRQTTSRSDDPQLHTHAVISSRVQTPDGRWLALDGRYVKRQQRMLGGLYQSVLRSELTARFGVAWGPIVKGQAEIAGVPTELLAVFSKRSRQIEAALAVKVDDFRQREGRDPSQWERAAMAREAAEDTRRRKSGAGVADLTSRWQTEAAAGGWDGASLAAAIDAAGRDAPQVVDGVTVAEIVEATSATRSSWSRADVLRVLCDVLPTMAEMSGRRWLDVLERAADHAVAQCIDLDPAGPVATRGSDGRSLWIHPTAPRFTSEAVLVEEEYVLSWAMAAQTPEPAPSTPVDGTDLDVLQADAAAAVAGDDRLVLVVGPAGAGKTRMLARAAVDLDEQGRAVFGLAPTAKAARVLERDTGIAADTVAKLLHEWQRTDRPPGPRYDLPEGTTVVVDEAGALSTPDLSELVGLANWQRWRLVLVGDHRQLQAVGRGGLFAELCATGHVHELEHLHRFRHRWEAAASLQLRAGDPRALDAYQDHGRIVAGPLEDHLTRMAIAWVSAHGAGDGVALVASTNDHVDVINRDVQTVRCLLGDLDEQHAVRIGGGERAHVGDIVATRRNDRHLLTSTGHPIRNREIWTVTALGADGTITVGGDDRGTVTLPADYVRQHVRLGYAATEHGWQSDTVQAAVALASAQTTRRGLYVAATRGQERNTICVVTDSTDVTEARDVLDAVIASDRADVPAVTQRRTLAAIDQPRPQPAPAPRCPIPDWFHQLRADTTAALDRADAAESERALQREARQVELEQQHAAAGREYAPYQVRLTDAEEAVGTARSRLRGAEQHLQGSGWRHRRSAHRLVETAEQRLDAAETVLQQAEAAAQPYRARVVDLDQRLHDIDPDGTIATILDQWSPDGRAHEQLHNLDTALDRWQRWANGHPITWAELGDSVHLLESVASSPDTAQLWTLGQAVRTWADDQGIDLAPPGRNAQHRLSISRESIGIEL